MTARKIESKLFRIWVGLQHRSLTSTELRALRRECGRFVREKSLIRAAR